MSAEQNGATVRRAELTKQIMPGCTVAHSWKAGTSSSASLIFFSTWCSYASMNEFMTTSPMRDTGW